MSRLAAARIRGPSSMRGCAGTRPVSRLGCGRSMTSSCVAPARQDPSSHADWPRIPMPTCCSWRRAVTTTCRARTAELWPTNLGSERDWGFQALPGPAVNGRALPLSMGKVGGGSSVNAQLWARGHRSDWDHFASESADPAWSYDSVLSIYRRIEDGQGAPDPKRRGPAGRYSSRPRPTPIRWPLLF